jgi:AmmeMemoRadiSam system protein B
MAEITDPSYVPTLRRYLSAERADGGYVLFDPRQAGDPIGLSAVGFAIVRMMEGKRSVLGLSLETGVAVEDVTAIVVALDEARLLDGPTWRRFVSEPVRQPTCVGVYPADPDGVRRQMQGLFTGKGGPGMPGGVKRQTDGRLRAVLLPHMDYTRGNVTYGHGFKALAEATDARLFVVVATSHHPTTRFTLSRQHFATPLGVVETDQAFVDRVVKRYGDRLFDDPAAHVPEHSIELELPPLQFLYESRSVDRPVRIVPLLVGSFGEYVEGNRSPREGDDVRRLAEALATAEAEAGEPVCYLISGDLAHIGPKFDDPAPLDDARLAHSRGQDERLLDALMRTDADDYFRVIADEGDERNICGLPPTYLALLATKPTAGRVLHYQQFVAPDRHESVSFAAAAFYG